ncbi:MAG TPA: tetratricopeptide repeat protein [Methanocorpusculum sp.]|nr:tetratricopeptide repeat protein [Methanocorpusculum sp.]
MARSGKKPTVSDPKDPVLWCKEAASRKTGGDLDAALFCYKEAVKLRPDTPDVWYNIIYLAEQTGDRATALAAACTAGKLFATDYRFPAEEARFFAEGGKPTEAIAASERALAINPHSPTLLSNKAGYLLVLGKNEEALKEAEAALAIDPTYVSAVLHKVHALVNLGNLVDADALLDDDLVSSDIRAIKMQVNICIRSQNLTKALARVEEATQIAPDDDEVWALCGITHACLNEKDEAAAALTKAIKLNPREKSYRTNLAALRKI